VLPASESVLLDQQRLELSLDHRGIVLAVNEAATKSIFGVEPSELVGRPLSSFINVFGQWKATFGDEESLLTSLALRVEESHGVVLRCGLHNPFSDAEVLQRYGGGAADHGPAAAALDATGGSAAGVTASGGGGGLLGALKARFKERPAVLTLSMIHPAEDADGANAAAAAAAAAATAPGGGIDLLSSRAAAASGGVDADALPLLRVCLWRAEALTSQVELDGKLGITRADGAAGLMFGLSSAALLHKSFKK
jgi:hypothetical protein